MSGSQRHHAQVLCRIRLWRRLALPPDPEQSGLRSRSSSCRRSSLSGQRQHRLDLLSRGYSGCVFRRTKPSNWCSYSIRQATGNWARRCRGIRTSVVCRASAPGNDMVGQRLEPACHTCSRARRIPSVRSVASGRTRLSYHGPQRHEGRQCHAVGETCPAARPLPRQSRPPKVDITALMRRNGPGLCSPSRSQLRASGGLAA